MSISRRSFLRSVAGLTGGAMLPGSFWISNNQSRADQKKSTGIKDSDKISVIGLGLYGEYAIKVLKDTPLITRFHFFSDEPIGIPKKEHLIPVFFITGIDYFLSPPDLIRFQNLRNNGFVPITLFIDHDYEFAFIDQKIKNRIEQLLVNSDGFYRWGDTLRTIADLLSTIEQSMNSEISIIDLDGEDIAGIFQNAGEIIVGKGFSRGEEAVKNAASMAIQMALTSDLQDPRKLLILFKIAKDTPLHLVGDATDIAFRHTPDFEQILFAATEIDDFQNKAEVTIIAGDFQRKMNTNGLI